MELKEFPYEHLFQHYSELFVKKLNDALEKSHHSQTSLAKLVNRSPNAVFKWTKGINIPSHVIEKILCDIFEIDQRYFSQEKMTFDEARDLKHSGEDSIKILKEKVERLENKLCLTTDKEESKENMRRMMEAVIEKHPDRIYPLVELLYKDLT